VGFYWQWGLWHPRFHILLHCDDYRYGHLVKVIPAIYEIPTWLSAFFSVISSIQNKRNSISQGFPRKEKFGMGKAQLKLYRICISGFICLFALLWLLVYFALILIPLWCFSIHKLCVYVNWVVCAASIFCGVFLPFVVLVVSVREEEAVARWWRCWSCGWFSLLHP